MKAASLDKLSFYLSRGFNNISKYPVIDCVSHKSSDFGYRSGCGYRFASFRRLLARANNREIRFRVRCAGFSLINEERVRKYTRTSKRNRSWKSRKPPFASFNEASEARAIVSRISVFRFLREGREDLSLRDMLAGLFPDDKRDTNDKSRFPQDRLDFSRCHFIDVYYKTLINYMSERVRGARWCELWNRARQIPLGILGIRIMVW